MAQQQIQKAFARLTGILGVVSIPLLAAPVWALINSTGASGIDARRLHAPPYNLLGRKIAIGQVEIGRPAVFGLDKAAEASPVVNVNQVFFRDGQATADELVDGHAANVASVMISSDKRLTGVAPEARLYSSAVGIIEQNGQPAECLSAQTVALQNGGDVRAINFSFGESLTRDPRPDAVLDGNALLTQCIDWSSNVHDVLYVIAGNQGRGGIPIPTDNFNGMTVTNSTLVGGQFVKVNFSSLSSEPPIVIGRSPELESNVGPRRSISLVAPGTNIEMFNPDGSIVTATGTSFAAPHVTATVALLQEYGDTAIRQSQAGVLPLDTSIGTLSLPQAEWTLDARETQVMKAVLMNSADKIVDRGDGLYLGMSRTIYDQGNKTWLESDAYTDPEKPLSSELGTGHLNAFRAYQQFSAGQWSPEDVVPYIGWDYRSVSSSVRNSDNVPKFRDYVIEQPLQAGSFISATLAWDRDVTLDDANGNGEYDIGETFIDSGLNDLNIYLMRADDSDIDDSIWSSVSEVDSVEHLFHEIPETGQYKIRVVYHDRIHDSIQRYALAWWSVPVQNVSP
jgi:hypothetical protein